MTATDIASMEINVLNETNSEKQAQIPTTVEPSKDKGPRAEIVNNCITTHGNEECI
jgi:hypothetical protein